MLGDGFKLSMDVIREVLGTIFTCMFSPFYWNQYAIIYTKLLTVNFIILTFR
jgi:hypothetical protein